jgi:hypothetical protein
MLVMMTLSRMSFQLPLSGSLGNTSRSGRRSIPRLSTPSLGITDLPLCSSAGPPERFQLPLSGSQELREPVHGSGPLFLSTPSLGITSRFRMSLFSSAFNSLSRDHLRGAEGHGGDVQADLSTPSLGITDCIVRWQLDIFGLDSVFQLPLSGSRVRALNVGTLIL